MVRWRNHQSNPIDPEHVGGPNEPGWSVTPTCPQCDSDLIFSFADMPGARPEHRVQAHCPRCGPVEVPTMPEGHDDGDEDALRLGGEAEALMPVCAQCGRRLSGLNGIGGQLLWVCSSHGAVEPDWVTGPAIPRTMSFPPTPDPPSSRRARSLRLGDIPGAVRAPKPQPKPAASFLDPTPRPTRPA